MLTTGKAELKMARVFETFRARTDTCFWVENARAHTAKARGSAPETRSLSMFPINSRSMPEIRPRVWKICRWYRISKYAVTAELAKITKAKPVAIRASCQL